MKKIKKKKMKKNKKMKKIKKTQIQNSGEYKIKENIYEFRID
jgi:hypothetical protein